MQSRLHELYFNVMMKELLWTHFFDNFYWILKTIYKFHSANHNDISNKFQSQPAQWPFVKLGWMYWRPSLTWITYQNLTNWKNRFMVSSSYIQVVEWIFIRDDVMGPARTVGLYVYMIYMFICLFYYLGFQLSDWVNCVLF